MLTENINFYSTEHGFYLVILPDKTVNPLPALGTLKEL